MRAKLELAVRVQQETSRVDDPVTLIVRLRNLGEKGIVVNRRLLLNVPEAPPGYGELFVETEGPPGYANITHFDVRTGAAQASDFAELAPGAHVGRAYVLTDYESLHLPGRYSVTVTYHNETAPRGLGEAVFCGAIRSSAVKLMRMSAG
jgi:hypothetical protein